MYNHIIVEKKWANYWRENKTFKFIDNDKKNKFYVLDMFPYPSGSGLHVGHPKGYTASDIISRFKRLNNFSVLHPIGWDAFGLPAEQYAIQTGNHPKLFTYKNIDKFRKQLQRLGFDYDYDHEVCTCDEKFYRWTQWIFIQLYKNGLAEIQNIDVNWCDNLKIVLANEEIVKNKEGENVSERGGHPVVKKKMKQWVLKITKFADELLSGLDSLDWTEGLKNIQKKWIGKSVGSIVDLKIDTKNNSKISIFTSKIEDIYDASFIGIAADSKILSEILKEPSEEIVDFISKVKEMKDYDREKINSEKFGIKTNLNCINPLTKELLPIYIVDYILPNFGTGAIMGIPSSNEKDYIFSKKYNIKISESFIKNKKLDKDLKEVRDDTISKLKKLGVYKDSTTYKLRDWLFSRQRYWGEPFPILFDTEGNILTENNLPLKLPELEYFSPGEHGESPLESAKDWLYTTIDNVKYTRDTNTMPQWAGSCWYYIGYIIKNNDGSYLDLDSKEAKKRLKRWLPVDIYIGGQEHAVLHLLYARFWHKFLYKIGVVDSNEPFQKVVNQGMILDSKGNKISKSIGNGISVDDICNEYGADTLRLYEMFMGPITQTAKWSSDSINGFKSWINKIYNIFNKVKLLDDKSILEKEFNIMVSGVTEDLENLQFNIAISKMMVFINYCSKKEELSKSHMEDFLIILSCFCPFLTQEIYSNILNKKDQISFREWPKFNESMLNESFIKLPITINGKVREVIEIRMDETQEEISDKIKKSEKIRQFISSKKITRVIYVKNKIYNILVK